MYKKVDTKLVQPELEQQVLSFWEEQKIFEKVSSAKANAPAFVFYDGPPGVNGMPHIGHVSNRIYKDIVLRYKTMQGYRVERKAGWDAHGLPVELQAEKELGFNNKQDIERYGVEGFVKKCKEIVSLYKSEWTESTKKIGYWVDLDDAYLTCTDDYIESVWWSLKEMFERGLIYKGYKVTPYCPRCGTSLATHEVAQGYKTVKDRTVYVAFRVLGEDNTYFVAWTTTPWTLPSNVALAVNPETQYCKVEFNKHYYIMAEALVSKVLPKAKVVSTFVGKDLEFKQYEPLFKLDESIFGRKKHHFVTCADYVTTTSGTGIVHIAPAFGEDDSNVGKQYDLPFVQLINQQGKFTEDLPQYAGMSNIDANAKIIADLKKSNAVIKEETVEHEYPHCWRCKTPLIYYARTGWFINMSRFRDNLVKNNNAVNFIPDNIKEGRMGNFVSNAVDWNLSRDRYWGTPLNIWECESCHHFHSIGSKAELRELSGSDEEVELHRPYVDNITIKCPKCGGTARRVPELIDCWFDSGAMPFAQWHYPFENKDKFADQFPADFICEAQDQTRGWFYTLQAISTVMFDKTPYKNCMVAGLVLDKDGRKMSKSVGNVVDPIDVVNRYGADTVRWFFASNSTPWSSKLFDENLLVEAQRKIIGTLWNTYAFYVLYANIDNFKPTLALDACQLSIMDKWVLSKLNTLKQNVKKLMDEYNFTDSARLIETFVEQLSNWYIRRCRERFWVDGENADKTAAFTTLYNVLMDITKLIAPMMPFISEEIYLNLRPDQSPISVHLCEYPAVDKQYIVPDLEQQMDKVIQIVTLGRVVRADTGIKNRQPLANMYVYSVNNLSLNEDMLTIICDDLNVKKFNFIDDTSNYIDMEVKPQLRTLGPKYGKALVGIKAYLAQCDSNKLVANLESGGTEHLNIDDVEVDLTLEDILVTPHSKPNFCAETDNGITVILDTVLTDDLIDEGIMREVISKLQNMRKEAGYEVEDKIEVEYSGNNKVVEVIQKFRENICSTVLATTMQEGQSGDVIRDVEINDLACKLCIRKV